MKKAIFYFSGTGNSLNVAKNIQRDLEDTLLFGIPEFLDGKIDNLNLGEFDSIGIVFPVYMWGLPLIVSEFIKNIKLQDNQYVFAIATCGGTPGPTLFQTKEELAYAGIKLSAGFYVKMPGNYTPLYGALPKRKQERLFIEASKKLEVIIDFIKNKKSKEMEGYIPIINSFLRYFYKKTYKKIPKMDKGFWVDDKCNSCSICEKICPVKNITMEQGRPVWHNKCQQCLRCLQWCPVTAIQYKKGTLLKKRYNHPEVKIQDFM